MSCRDICILLITLLHSVYLNEASSDFRWLSSQTAQNLNQRHPASDCSTYFSPLAVQKDTFFFIFSSFFHIFICLYFYACCLIECEALWRFAKRILIKLVPLEKKLLSKEENLTIKCGWPSAALIILLYLQLTPNNHPDPYKVRYLLIRASCRIHVTASIVIGRMRILLGGIIVCEERVSMSIFMSTSISMPRFN